MDSSLHTLCQSISALFTRLRANQTPLSFSILLGKTEHGKTCLLKQTSLEQLQVQTSRPVTLFYNTQGVILELNEAWVQNHSAPLTTILKHLNRAAGTVRISGVIYCMDVHDIMISDPEQFLAEGKIHIQKLKQFGRSLGYRVPLALFITKLDTLAGFIEFFHGEHAQELQKPLGFSIEGSQQKEHLIQSFKKQFDRLSEFLGQSVIQKIHPIRAGAKRTLIREFPLQIATIKPQLQSFIQAIPFTLFNIRALYFTSAEQGGLSHDRINKKIHHEYALVVQDTFAQSTNFKPYFIQGAIDAFMQQSQQLFVPHKLPNKWMASIAAGAVLSIFLFIITKTYHTTHALNSAQKELAQFEHLMAKPNSSVRAFYHLNRAVDEVGTIRAHQLVSPHLYELKQALIKNTHQHINKVFIPHLMLLLEEKLKQPAATPQERFDALKTYLMLGDKKHFSQNQILQWFTRLWHEQGLPNKTLTLNEKTLKNILAKYHANAPLNQSLISDTQHYFEALPAPYLFYTLAKDAFPKQTISIKNDGFHLFRTEVPYYFTKEGFHFVEKNLSQVITSLHDSSWVINQTLPTLETQTLLNLYAEDYARWWEQFVQHTQPDAYQSYAEGHKLVNTWEKGHTISQLLSFIQKETAPDSKHPDSSFNKLVASKFTDINLITHTTRESIDRSLFDLEKFMNALSLVNDQGQTAFHIAKSRFTSEQPTDPLSQIYTSAQTLPQPMNQWLMQIADNTWSLIMRDSRKYINQQWEEAVYTPYENTIAARFPFTPAAEQEVDISDFNHFFSQHGNLKSFMDNTLKPFIDMSEASWKPKAKNGFQLPISPEIMNELIRANVIHSMFFPHDEETTNIHFSLQKISLDPVVAHLSLTLGSIVLEDNQNSESDTEFTWPGDGASLSLQAIDGNHFKLEEKGPWAFFKMLQKVNVLIDDNDSKSLQILFEINGNSGRYTLKTDNLINPFIPGILNGFSLDRQIV